MDLSSQFAYIMSMKDDGEVTTIKKAAHVTSVLFDKFFKQQVVKIVDEEKSVKHSKLSDQIEQALDSKKYLGQGMDPEQVWFYPFLSYLKKISMHNSIMYVLIKFLISSRK